MAEVKTCSRTYGSRNGIRVGDSKKTTNLMAVEGKPWTMRGIETGRGEQRGIRDDDGCEDANRNA
jgi:hypothetical protein